MKHELAQFYRRVAFADPRRNRILLAGLSGSVLSMLAGFGLDASRYRFVADWDLLGVLGSLLLIGSTIWHTRTTNELIQIGQFKMFHRRRGVVEVELDVGTTWRADARRIAQWTADMDDSAWHDLTLFVRTAVLSERWLRRMGFATRCSSEKVRLIAYVLYTVKWFGWAVRQAVKGKRPPKYRQGARYIEAELKLARCVCRWLSLSGPRAAPV